MLTINIDTLIQSLLKRGMTQAHMGYDFTICKGSKIPSKLKSSIKENSSNFFNDGSDVQYVVMRVPENKTEPSDATSKIVQLIKTNFLDGDPNNTFTTSEVQVGYIEMKSKDKGNESTDDESDKADKKDKSEPEKRMYYVLKFKID